MYYISIAGQLILSLSILVVLHECGHFFPAKWFKTKVEKFYLFFNPGFSLFKKQIGETEYGVGWIPFGGYVKIAGMIDESMDTEQLKQEPQPWEFRSKPAWQRLIIMLGGVTVNFILGALIFGGMLWYFGESYIKNDQVKYGVATTEMGELLGIQDGDKVLSIGDYTFDKYEPQIAKKEIIVSSPQSLVVERDGQKINLNVPENFAQTLTKGENKDTPLYTLRWPQKIAKVKGDSPAEKANLKKGDMIVGVNGQSTPYVNDVAKALAGKKSQKVSLTYLKDGKDSTTVNLDLGEDGVLGVFHAPREEFFEISKQKYSLGAALPKGVTNSVDFLNDQLKAFGKMFTGKLKAKDSLGSVFSIAQMFDASWNWERFWQITASLSILLGFFNLLPIPALDGGYVMFLLWEVITGKKPNDKFMEYATITGFFILIGLMIFAIGLDFSKFEWVKNLFGG